MHRLPFYSKPSTIMPVKENKRYLVIILQEPVAIRQYTLVWCAEGKERIQRAYQKTTGYGVDYL